MQERLMFSNPAEMVTFKVPRENAESEQVQYQQDVFQTLLKWVAGVCILLSLAYLVAFVQQSSWAALVIGATFTTVSVVSLAMLRFVHRYNFVTMVRLWLALASWTVFSFGLLQHFDDNFIQIMAMGAIIVIMLAVFLEPMRISYQWAFLNIGSYIFVTLTRSHIQIPAFSLGVLHPLVVTGTPIAVLLIVTELGRATTQHFKYNLIQSEMQRAQLGIQERRMRAYAAETESAREKAERADRVKSAFLASMSHELRTPLNSVINFTHFVLDGDAGAVTENQKDLLREVVRSAQHLLDLINDVLDISKIEAGSLSLFVEENIDVGSIIDSAAAMARSLLIGKPIQLLLNVDANLPLVRGDQQRIFQILVNILLNACKFTEEGHIRISAHASDDKILIALEDSGPGIALEEHGTIFEPFKQTKVGLRQGSGGTGLGLPIAKSLAEAHGGTIWLQSEPGKGAMFFVSIPVQSKKLESPLV